MSKNIPQNNFMLEALNQARIALEFDEVPVGAVIVENNQIISRGFNQNRQKLDPTSHAEIVALRSACDIKKSNKLENCDIYITLEPCAMCLIALSYARIRRIYYGANDEKFGAIESNPLFLSAKNAYFKSEFYSGICADESTALLRKFFQNKR
jgi:tRNA(Arg) A34 adenosine deaminase TadA